MTNNLVGIVQRNASGSASVACSQCDRGPDQPGPDNGNPVKYGPDHDLAGFREGVEGGKDVIIGFACANRQTHAVRQAIGFHVTDDDAL